ncbi:MAG: formimidoylglutamase [Clostridia bacterium]|nr:formimidoylglutamase [Clostridia bacterium]
MLSYYQPTQKEFWTGRIDSTIDFDAFRWHQWIECLDLKEDLKPFDGILGIAIIGFQSDLGVRLNKGREGAASGPIHIRKELMNLPCHFKQELKLFDMGDIIAKDNLNDSQMALAEAVEKIIDLNLFPIVLGGGHEVALGNHLGAARKFNRLGIVNFDAHFDLRPYEKTGTSGTMFHQIADIKKAENNHFDYCCIGIQQRGNTRMLFNLAKSLEVPYILARDITQENMVNIFSRIDRFTKNKDALHVTICMDVFASAYAPGVSSAQPLGLQPWPVISMLKYLLRNNRVATFDIAEVSPRFDQDNITANLASTLVFHTVQQLAECYDLDFGDIF